MTMETDRSSAARSAPRRLDGAAERERAKMTSPDRVADAVTRNLRAGIFVPGQRVSEADLTQELRVSRGPVREALKRLAAEGVLTVTRNRGAYVRALSRVEVRDSLVVLEALVGVMADLAARRISENDNTARMRDCFKRLLA